MGTLVRKLDTGDYSIDGMESLLVIDRKRNVAEIAMNITDKRFEKELVRMQSYKYAFLICEFSETDIDRFPEGSTIPKSRWNKVKTSPNFIKACLRNYAKDRDIVVLLCGDRETAKEVTYSIIKMVADAEKT